jgi:hypothetical protein
MSNGMRGYTGDSVPTNRVIRTKSYVTVRNVPKYTPSTKAKIHDYEFSLTQLERTRRIDVLSKLLGYSN